MRITTIFDTEDHVIGFAKVTRDDTDRMLANERDRQLELLSERERVSVGLCDSIARRIFEVGLVLDSTLGLLRDRDAEVHIVKAITLLDDTVVQILNVLAGDDLPPDGTVGAR